ncbi:MAG: LysM peptidoglycan-binding domain-containing protein [Opitutales bacterium]
MDDDLEASSGTGGSLIPLAVAVLALLAGGLALFFGWKAQQAAAQAGEASEAGASETAGRIAALEERIAGQEEALGEIRSSLEALKTRSRMDRDQVRQALNDAADQVLANREQINRNTRNIAAIPDDLEKKLEAFSPPARPAGPSPSADTGSRNGGTDPGRTSAPTAGPGQSVHVIESGDTFQRLANEYGVPLDAILDANAGVDPRRLRIGQEVIIPRP